MDDHYYDQVKEKYQEEKYQDGDLRPLFETLLSIAETIGHDPALALLERCAIEKRQAWLDQHLDSFERTGNPVEDGYRLFYEIYLGVSAPDDGEIVEQYDQRMVTRWWNACPLLDFWVEMELDTREICRKTYEKPVQIFLERIDPRLRFIRNYDRIRPHLPYCEETIALEE